MPDNITNVTVTKGEWVDLYALSGISVGTAIFAENIGSRDVYIAVQATQPDPDHDAYNIVKRNGSPLRNSGGDAGAWAFCANADGKLNVSPVSDSGFYPPLTSSNITDKSGRTAKISQQGELITGSYVDDVDISFQYAIRSADTVIGVTGTGIVSHPGVGGSYAEISPGAGVGAAQMVSKSPVRSRAGHEGYCELSIVFREPEPNLDQWYGFLNTNDRWVVGYQGETFGLMFREGGNDTFIASTAFNFDKLDGGGPSGYTINQQAINVYRLAFVWHGGLPLTLDVQINQQWQPVHVLDFGNIIDETHLENPHLPVGGLVERTVGTGTDQASRTGSWRGGSYATLREVISDDWLSWAVLDRILTGGLDNIVTFHNPTSWQGKINHIVYSVAIVTFVNDANKTVVVYGNTNGVLTGGGAINYIDEDNYALQYQEGGTISGGDRGPATVVRAGGDRYIDDRGTGIRIYPGETFAIEVDPGGPINGSFSAVVRLIHEG